MADEDVRTVHYWMYAPGSNATKWEDFYKAGIMAIGWGEIGDLSAYSSKAAMKQRMKETINPELSYVMSAHATWQFANEMKPGDIVYAKRGLYQLVGRGIVTSDYEYDPSYEDGYPNIRHVNWTDYGEWEHPGQVVQKTLTDITQYTDYVQKLEALFIKDNEDEDEPEAQFDYPAYDEKQFLRDVYMDKAAYDTLVGLVRTKKNIILQGAPGVGKTYTAKRLAYSMMGVKDQERIMMVQFHQSYSYEDFIEGFRPASGGNGFEIKKGSFYHFCKKAADDQENEYFFIIDEINRGNLSKIFGELFMLIENDKRGNALQLLYSDEKFYVWVYPNAVYLEKEILDGSRYEKDASDVGNNCQILNFTGSFCNILKSDGSLCSKTITPYAGLLLNLLNYQDGIERGLKLCRYVKDKVLWTAFSAICINYREIQIAETAVAAIDEVDKVNFIEKIIKLKEGNCNDNLISAYVLLLSNKVDEAEKILLQGKLIYRAIKININLYRWDRALKLAVDNGTHVDTVLAYREKYLKNAGLTEVNSKFLELSKDVTIDWDKIKEKIAEDKKLEMVKN